MKSDGETVGLATVYRTLQALTRTGRLDVLVAGDGESLYRQCEASGHHHHLVCRECGRTVEFLAPKLEAAMSAIAGDHGFTEIGRASCRERGETAGGGGSAGREGHGEHGSRRDR